MINCEKYLNRKLELLKSYFEINNIKGVVLGLSGGVDSSVTLGIYREFEKRYPEFGFVIVTANASISNSIGTTEQDEANKLANIVLSHFYEGEHSIWNPYELGKISEEFKKVIMTDSKTVVQQTDYWLRPTLFYGLAAHYSENPLIDGHVILSSTCNKSEWISGYFSSYLDILAINPIIDIWKSEVYQLAEYFNIPSIITDTPPKGGLANGNTDEEELEFTYDDLENWYMNTGSISKELGRKIEKRYIDSNFKRYKFNKDWIDSVSINLLDDVHE